MRWKDCDISGHSLACVAIHSGADPYLRRNRIHNGGTGVIIYKKNGQGTPEDNEIFANAGCGVVIQEGGNPTLRRNRISQNKDWGIQIVDGGRGIFEGNDLRGNAKGAWEIPISCGARMQRANNIE